MNLRSSLSSKWPEGVPDEIIGFNKPLFSILDNSAREFPEAVYTMFQGASRNFRQVRDTADRISNFLVSEGLVKGDRVAVFLPNIPHYPAIFFGILKAGCVCVTCNPLYKAAELNLQLKDSGAKAVFVMDHPGFYQTALDSIKQTNVRTVVICGIKSYLPVIKGIMGSLLGKIPKAEGHENGHFIFESIVKAFSPDPPKIEINPVKDYALILYTGGTTGIPKGAALTHANLMSNVMSMEEWIRIPETTGGPPIKLRKGGEHTFLGVLPWYHAFGLTLCMLTSCITSSRLVCVPDPRAGRPPFSDVLKSIRKYNITIVIAVPTIYNALVNQPLTKKLDLSSIRACGSGAAPMPAELIRKFEAMTGCIIFEGYGLTETSPVVTANPTNIEQRKIGSVGLPLPGVEIKIIDLADEMKDLSEGEDGEIAVSGPQIMAGYWNKKEENDLVFRDISGKRFFLTGDIGHLDQDGFLVITDRKKDMIVVGGFNVYPADVEGVLYSHPKISQAAVIGVPDKECGELVKAFVQLKPGTDVTAEEIIDFCKENMAAYKRPRIIEFRESLPTSPVGKVLRRVLKDEERDMRNQSSQQGLH
ncbi:MAG: long-chain fatty acid--CoA ligase [Deltaproteobacteria bacterium]|nr:long-chain fatty acid--CoA ligase [Deltaproteobacteria bacterium]